MRGCKRTTSEHIGSTSHVTLLSGKFFLICDTRHRPRATSPIDPIRMMRIEGAEGNILKVGVSITKLINIQKFFEIPNIKHQIPNRFKAIVFLFRILNFGHCFLFVFLGFVI